MVDGDFQLEQLLAVVFTSALWDLEDVEGLSGMVKMVAEAVKKPRPISGIALRLDGDEWTPVAAAVPSLLQGFPTVSASDPRAELCRAEGVARQIVCQEW